jgi:hypothetical protein
VCWRLLFIKDHVVCLCGEGERKRGRTPTPSMVPNKSSLTHVHPTSVLA